MELEASMRKSVDSTQRTFNTIRTGRANASLLDKIQVEVLRRRHTVEIPGHDQHPGFLHNPAAAV